MMNTAATYLHNHAFPYCHLYRRRAAQTSFLIFALPIRYYVTGGKCKSAHAACFSINRFPIGKQRRGCRVLRDFLRAEDIKGNS